MAFRLTRRQRTERRSLVAPVVAQVRDKVGKANMGNMRAGLILTTFLILCLLVLPVQLVASKVHKPSARQVPFRLYRILHKVIGLNVIVHGAPVEDRSVLFVSNHVSWMDIPILGGVTPCCFIAKSEVGTWPFFGTMARAGRTVFLERERRSKAADQKGELQRRLEDGDNLVLFPEGTSNDGNRVLPFKSALFSAAQTTVGANDDPVMVQPISVTYTKLNGMPMGRQFRPFFAWYGDMDLLPHLWKALSLGRVQVDVHFHEPVTINEIENRKQMAERCYSSVEHGVVKSLRGRPEDVFDT